LGFPDGLAVECGLSPQRAPAELADTGGRSFLSACCRKADFYRLTALRAVDVVQMDLAHCGGILAGKKVAAMAAPQDMVVAPHCSIGPVALAACLHFDVSTPNFLVQEAFAEFDVPWRDQLVAGW